MIDAKRDNVVAEQLIRSKTSSGLIVPSTVNDPQAYGRVLSAGEEVNCYKKGDIVIFHSNGGQVIVLENKLLRVLKEQEIYGVLVDTKVLSTLKEATMKEERMVTV